MEMAKETTVKAKKEAKPKKPEIFVVIPAGVSASVEGNLVKVKGAKGEISRKFVLHDIVLEKKDDKIVVISPSPRKADKAKAGSIHAHIKNMVASTSNGVLYKMKIVYSHFPMNVKVQGDKFVIDNFLGEKHPRKAKILKNVTVEVKGQDVTVKGIDKEIVSQTAANIEQITKITKRDLRVFQDGIYITEKDGKPIK
jgi:large subunit ribosomal protein L6